MPRDVGCPLCGKRFFRHSLPIHLPQCEKKRSALEMPCPNCDELVRGDDMLAHRRRCKRAPRHRFRGGPTNFGSGEDITANALAIAFAPRSPSGARSPQPFTKAGTPIARRRRPPAAAAA